MKNLICFATIATTVITLFAVKSVRAQGVFVQPFPSTGYSSTTIYVPSLPAAAGYGNGTTTTTIVVPVAPNPYPNTNSFPDSTTTPYYGGGYPSRRYPYPQPTVVFPQQNMYPRDIQSACTTSIVGSPIPSPIALNKYTGTPCR